MRVLITGMGGELGGRVATLLAAHSAVGAIVGLDCDHPREPIDGTELHRVNPRDREATAVLVHDFAPTAIVHLGVYEPFARSSPKASIERTINGSIGLFDAVARCGSVDRIVVRSGLEVYGRRRGGPVVPDEDVAPDPTTPFGHVFLHAERLARDAGLAAAAPVTTLRFAPVLGPRFPSPLGRYLRLPVVAFSAVADPPFSVLHVDDAAAAIAAAVLAPVDGPLNVVAAGAVRVSQAARRGGRLAMPVAGPGWRAATVAAELSGAPVPEHVYELLSRGRTADGSRAPTALGWTPTFTTVDVIEELHGWASAPYVPRTRRAAA